MLSVRAQDETGFRERTQWSSSKGWLHLLKQHSDIYIETTLRPGSGPCTPAKPAAPSVHHLFLGGKLKCAFVRRLSDLDVHCFFLDINVFIKLYSWVWGEPSALFVLHCYNMKTIKMTKSSFATFSCWLHKLTFKRWIRLLLSLYMCAYNCRTCMSLG